MATKKPVKKKAPNPVKRDPTRTVMLRKGFTGSVAKEFNKLKRSVVTSVTADNGRWNFQTDDAKLDDFEKWLRHQANAGILKMPSGVPHTSNAYWQAYVQQGYTKGLGRAYSDTKKGKAKNSDQYMGGQKQFLQTTFNRPVAVNRLRLLTVRTFTDLKGVTDTMATRLTRVLADGFVKGEHPNKVAKLLAAQIDKSKHEAERIARTEIIRAHAEGQLIGLEELGVDEIGVAVEWDASDRACPLCASMDGVVLHPSEAHGLIPRHPNCQCAFVPANVGESTKGQKRGKGEIRRAFDKSVRAERPKAKLKTAKEKSRWVGAGKYPGAAPKSKVKMK